MLETVGTAGAGETIQAVISGSADIGIGVGVAGVMRAFSKGAPVRILAPAFTGTGDLYWYVKADSPLKTLKDATDKNTIAYSTNGSSSHNIVLAFVTSSASRRSRPPPAARPRPSPRVMSGQIDIGWAAPPFGRAGDRRTARSASSRAAATCRRCAARPCASTHRQRQRAEGPQDAVVRFMQAYREAVDWMYADPKALR